MSPYVLFSPSVEKKLPDEEAINAQILESFACIQAKAEAKQGCPERGAHAKSHGILKGDLFVLPGLAPEFQQGAFQDGASYPVIMRFSSSPSELMSDSVGGFRGLGIKLIGVKGDQLQRHCAFTETQDLLFINHPTFPAKDIAAFLPQALLLEKVTINLPESVMEVQAAAGRLGGAVARMIGFDPAGTGIGMAKAESHPAGETYFTAAPLRYGDYIAKICLAPVSDSLAPLIGQVVPDVMATPDAVRDAMVAFFASNDCEYELRVQLCTNLESMPIEDYSVQWSEAESPFVPVARLRIPKQNAYSVERASFGNGTLSFSPWHGVVAHQPLGSIMRARREIYERSSMYRHLRNKHPMIEPQSIDELPD